jgi:hypothetical protein
MPCRLPSGLSPHSPPRDPLNASARVLHAKSVPRNGLRGRRDSDEPRSLSPSRAIDLQFSRIAGSGPRGCGLTGDTAREATSDEVKELKAEARQLKETLAEVLIENRPLKKAFSGMGGRAQQHLMSATSSSSSCMPRQRKALENAARLSARSNSIREGRCTSINKSST